MSTIGIVTIGRNEGDRLRRGLLSKLGRGLPVVYVDSNSTDGSAQMARSLGVEVIELDPSSPVGVPRARNEGFQRLMQIDPEIRYVQFIDGDCELVDGWLDQAVRALEERPEVGLVTGRRRERFRDASIYNRLADLEWDTPVGEIHGSHGDVMVRAQTFREIGGFDPAVLVSEDYELCLRLRKGGSILLRIDGEVSVHDMAMTRFGQWWWRTVRSGYGYADGAYLHGKSPERHCVRDVRSIVFWGMVLPLLAFGLAWPTRGTSLALCSAYSLLYWRVRRYALSRGWSPSDAHLYGLWTVLAKFPMAVGLVTYWSRLVRRRPKQIIEYKGSESDRILVAASPGSSALERQPCREG
jgi:GT2 family glycosyltransferase